MKLFTKKGDFVEADALPNSFKELESFLADTPLTTSSQQKLALSYFESGEYDICSDLLQLCISEALFDSEDLERLNLTLLAFYIELSSERKYTEECTRLFTVLENTKYKEELDYIKGYFFFYSQKYDTALFLLKNDPLGRNLINLTMNFPERVETNDTLLMGYKAYLEKDVQNAVKYFKQEYKTNKKVLPYLLRLVPDEFLNDVDTWTKNTVEYKLIAMERENKYTENELLDAYGDLVQDEFLYEKGKAMHISGRYEEALGFYIKCKGRRADYQAKRILGLPFEKKFEMNEFYNLKKKRLVLNPVTGFFFLGKIKKYLDETTYYANRGCFLYFIDRMNEKIKAEVLEDLGKFDKNFVIEYFDRALKTADSEQIKGVLYNKQLLESGEYEPIKEDLKNAVLNVKSDPNQSLKTFIKYLQKENNVTAAKGIGVVLAMCGDSFCKQIFKYLRDDYNLRVFTESQKK